MDDFYPAGPQEVPANLTAPTPSYRRQAWLAVSGLLLFVIVYFLLAGLFAWTAYRLIGGALDGGDEALLSFGVGTASAILALFMVKGLFFVQRAPPSDDIEVKAEEEPTLFEFLHRLADEAGAPRPHRVFLSPRVNAAVFYDLSVLNFFFASRKNLEIGLALVNVLSLGEFKAVLAHEFGHFAQRSMAVGRWVYIAQQIAGQIVARRDAFDRFLQGLSRIDLRVAWIGWLLSLIVWSIRSLTDTLFGVVLAAQRALSREMELQADLVAVSLTGSDALIHALHKLQAADEAWDRTLAFASAEAAKGRAVSDLFAVQTRVIRRVGEIFSRPDYGVAPSVPESGGAQHRVFKAELAQAPRMWATHPANDAREANAKASYIAAAIDARKAWVLFNDASALRERMSAHVLRAAPKVEPAPLEASLRSLDAEYARAYLDRRYRGAYLGRSVVRGAEQLSSLYEAGSAPPLSSLYPESLAATLARLREVEREKAVLEAVREGQLSVAGGVVQHRGRALSKRELPGAIEALRKELATLRMDVEAHDRACRSAHLAAAARVGQGWKEYLAGLAALLHYAEHAEANLLDAHGMYRNVLAIVTADRKVSNRELKRLLAAGQELYEALAVIHRVKAQVRLDPALAQSIGVATWPEALEELKLPPPSQANVGDWVNAVDGWVGAASGALSALRLAALEQLLLAEARVAGWDTQPAVVDAAPPPPAAPGSYPVLVPGRERARQRRLDLWSRFQTADGWLPGIARLSVALAIVGGVLGWSATVGRAHLAIHNGLALPVVVDVNGTRWDVGPRSTRFVDLQPAARYAVETHGESGQLLERFDEPAGARFGQYVYNVAGAAPLVEWAAVYGGQTASAPRGIGAPRWLLTRVDHALSEPPESIRSKSGSGTRTVLSAVSEGPRQTLSALPDAGAVDAVVAAHAHWDRPGTPELSTWLALAAERPGFEQLLQERLRLHPRDILALRLEQDQARGSPRHAEVCSRHRAMSPAGSGDADLLYLAHRCIEDEAERERAFLDGYRDHPQSAWMALAAGYVMAERAEWDSAKRAFGQALRGNAGVTDQLAIDVARIRRLTDGSDVQLQDLAALSEGLRYLLALEEGKPVQDSPLRAFHELAQGNLDQALSSAQADAALADQVLRLAAASDGASRELQERALALAPEAGLTSSTVWSSLALALRHGQPHENYLTLVDRMTREPARMHRVIDALSSRASAAQTDAVIEGLDPALRGQAYAMAIVVLGRDAPAAWREQARRLLFEAERPFFAT